MPTVELAGRGTMAYRWAAGHPPAKREATGGDGAETVVLVNGSVFNFRQWERQALPVLLRGLEGRCRFLLYDYIGVGGSSAKTAPFSMPDLADELRDLLDALSVERVHLLGMSKGSLVGRAFLIRHGERARSFCGLGNFNVASPHAARAYSAFKERVQALDDLEELWPERVNRRNFRRIFDRVYVPALFAKTCAGLSLAERLRAFIVRRTVYSSMEGTFVRTMADLFRYYAEDIAREAAFFAVGLPRVRGVPVLLLNGTADTTTPVQMSRELAETFQEAELVEFEGFTHMGPMLLKKEARSVFERYVAFMDGVLKRA